MTKFTIGLQAQLVVQTQQNMFALSTSDRNPNRGWGNINIQAVIIGLYTRFVLQESLEKTFQVEFILFVKPFSSVRLFPI